MQSKDPRNISWTSCCHLPLIQCLFFTNCTFATSLNATTNCWTSPNVTDFMEVTGHYLDPNVNLKSIPLGLTEIEGKLVLFLTNRESQQYDVAPIEPATKAMTDKLSKYLKTLLCKKPLICAMFLDPCFKFKPFNTYDYTLTYFGTSSAHLRAIFEEDVRFHFEEADPAENNAEIPSTTTTNFQALYNEMYPTSSIEASTLESKIEQFFSDPP
ncbi:hypothetical protein O181_056062 [Austropuccinia psidii MF-1]|uniref:Uncharacterized protein n=1 Tax=Austropuccinia psidii MF-1 TaxID=1389203 RepID=A0A9Q3EEY6_9BASI|nr:hypothetical protein [Austropuccinia psidii MF-1]